jgi:hypothetical protein
MKRLTLLATALAVLVIASTSAKAASASGTLAVSATISSSIQLTFQNGSGLATLTSGANTNAATLNLGTISAFGTSSATPAGISLATNSSTGAVDATGNIGVLVNMANLSSVSYTLKAYLNTADAVNTWKLNAVNVSSATSGSPATLTTTGTPNSVFSMPFDLTVSASQAAGSLSNTVNLTATSN